MATPVALKNPNYTELYAQLCALVIKDQKSKTPIKSKKTFLTSLVPKCRELLYSYKTNINTPTRGIINIKNYPINIMLANCKFIGELYNQGILLGKTMRSIIDKLIIERGNIQMNCLCIILTSIGPYLAKIYNIPKLFDYIRWVERNQYDGKLCKTLIDDIKILHSKWSINRDAQELIVDQQPASGNMNSVTIIISPIELSLLESVHKCIDLLFNFSSGEINDDNLLTPNIKSLLNNDQKSLVVFIIIVAVNSNRLECRKDAGKLLANMVRAELLSKYLVLLGFNNIIHDDCTNSLFPNIVNLIEDIQTEYHKCCKV